MTRNIANTAYGSDMSIQGILQYTIDVLKVTDIIVAGHYGCGGVGAALTKTNYAALEFYLSRLRLIYYRNKAELDAISDSTSKTNRLVELNVMQQVTNVIGSHFVQAAWHRGQTVRVHGLVYDMSTGRLNNLYTTKHQLSDVPSSLAVVSVSSSSSTSSSSSDDTNTGLIVGLSVGIPMVIRMNGVIKFC